MHEFRCRSVFLSMFALPFLCSRFPCYVRTSLSMFGLPFLCSHFPFYVLSSLSMFALPFVCSLFPVYVRFSLCVFALPFLCAIVTEMLRSLGFPVHRLMIHHACTLGCARGHSVVRRPRVHHACTIGCARRHSNGDAREFRVTESSPMSSLCLHLYRDQAMYLWNVCRSHHIQICCYASLCVLLCLLAVAILVQAHLSPARVFCGDPWMGGGVLVLPMVPMVESMVVSRGSHHGPCGGVQSTGGHYGMMHLIMRVFLLRVIVLVHYWFLTNSGDFW